MPEAEKSADVQKDKVDDTLKTLRDIRSRLMGVVGVLGSEVTPVNRHSTGTKEGNLAVISSGVAREAMRIIDGIDAAMSKYGKAKKE